MGNERFDISTPKEYLTKDKARLLYVSSATYGGDWISTPHTHYCSELFYVIEGMGQYWNVGAFVFAGDETTISVSCKSGLRD